MEKITQSIVLIRSLAVAASSGGGGSTSSTTTPTTSSGTNTTDCPHQITNILPCTSSGDGSVWNLLTVIVNFLAIGVGMAVVVGIIFGAFLYATSGGSADQAKKGIGYVRNAVLALLLFTFMWALINFIVPGGLFHA